MGIQSGSHNAYKTLASEVENVQRRATKLLSTIKDKTYPQRLEGLKLPSLEHRRLRGDMIDVYKYTHNLYDTDRPYLEISQSKTTRGHCLKLEKKCCSKILRQNYFSFQVVDTWNALPESVVTAPSVNAFKNRLDNRWRDLQTLYDPKCYD